MPVDTGESVVGNRVLRLRGPVDAEILLLKEGFVLKEPESEEDVELEAKAASKVAEGAHIPCNNLENVDINPLNAVSGRARPENRAFSYCERNEVARLGGEIMDRDVRCAI